jgi:hypothetical protein
MVATPWPTLCLMAIYLVIVKVGPKLMENRKAWELREVLVVYNFGLVLLSAYMLYEVIVMNASYCTTLSYIIVHILIYKVPGLRVECKE